MEPYLSYQIAFENILMKKTRVCNQTEKSTALYKTNSDLVSYRFSIELMLIRRSAKIKRSSFLHTRNCGKTEVSDQTNGESVLYLKIYGCLLTGYTKTAGFESKSA